ncbi:MAG: GyrI-like domain-containing protein, partial [Chitinophagaceae bacterium]
YKLVDQLRIYIANEGARETNNPMLHIRPVNDQQFETMVAIPVDKVLQGNKDIFLRRMIPGNILVTEVKGGRYTIDEGLKTLETYLSDYQKTSPAIPFESLVTDRSKESDTSKWVTRLYYPVL